MYLLLIRIKFRFKFFGKEMWCYVYRLLPYIRKSIMSYCSTANKYIQI